MRAAPVNRLIALGLVLLLAGCEVSKSSFSYRLWNTDDFRHFREPATNPAVAVFYDPQQNDFLVAYDSVRDGGDDPRRMAYYVAANQRQLSEGRKVRFTATNRLSLTAWPVNAGTTPGRADFDRQLTIHTSAGPIGPYPLPNYEESSGVAAQIALTPIAVAGDVAFVSLIAGVLAAWIYAGAGCINCSP